MGRAPDPAEYAARLDAELAISLASPRARFREYEDRRWALASFPRWPTPSGKPATATSTS
jgi:hypothetical protein